MTMFCHTARWLDPIIQMFPIEEIKRKTKIKWPEWNKGGFGSKKTNAGKILSRGTSLYNNASVGRKVARVSSEQNKIN